MCVQHLTVTEQTVHKMLLFYILLLICCHSFCLPSVQLCCPPGQVRRQDKEWQLPRCLAEEDSQVGEEGVPTCSRTRNIARTHNISGKGKCTRKRGLARYSHLIRILCWFLVTPSGQLSSTLQSFSIFTSLFFSSRVPMSPYLSSQLMSLLITGGWLLSSWREKTGKISWLLSSCSSSWVS